MFKKINDLNRERLISLSTMPTFDLYVQANKLNNKIEDGGSSESCGGKKTGIGD